MSEIRLLLVDDHEIIRAGLRALAARTPGWEVVGEADDGVEATRLALALRPNVLLLDMMLPSTNGLEVARRLRAAHFGGRIILLSAHAGEELAREAHLAGIDAVLHKHSSFAELRAVIEGGKPQAPAEEPASGEDTSESARLATLTPREREVLAKIATGAPAKEIAAEMGISVKTLDVHRHRLLTKLGANGTADLTRIAVRAGIAQL